MALLLGCVAAKTFQKDKEERKIDKEADREIDSDECDSQGGDV